MYLFIAYLRQFPKAHKLNLPESQILKLFAGFGFQWGKDAILNMFRFV